MDIQNVLISDAVDQSCVDLLKKYAIQVDCKYKLPKDQLIAEIQVRIFYKNLQHWFIIGFLRIMMASL